MNITLIYPLLSRERSRIDENKQFWPPLGLAYIAAMLRNNGHSVQILDRDLILRKSKFDYDKTDEITLCLIKDFNAQIVGFSVTTPNVSDANVFSEKVKKSNPSVITVIGGPHCAGEPVSTLEICRAIDVLVRGEGEMTMLDIANCLPFDSIRGLTHRKPDGTIKSNLDRPLIEDLDALPFPARDLLEMNYYTRPSRFIGRNLSLRATHIFTARGCPYNCHYCAGPLIGQRKVRYHSPYRVVSEIEEVIDRYSIEAIYFAEDMFLSSKQRAMEITSLFKERSINKRIVWMAQISPKVVDSEILSMMKEAGCVHVEYGFESGSQRVLDLMNKMANVERNKEVTFLTRKSGLRFQGNFIVGYPGESEDDFKRTITFIKDTRPNNVSLNIFMPLPGTEIYKKLKESGSLLVNWDDIGNPETPAINYADMPYSRFEKLYFNAKLKVILPMNLFYFLKDNLRHPIRLFYVLFTQFKGVALKTVKSLIKLRNLKKSIEYPETLFVAYQSLSCSVMLSQGLSYIRPLSKKGIRYYLLTFETKDSIYSSRKLGAELNMLLGWEYLKYHRNLRVFATFFDVVLGMLKVLVILIKNRITVIHARGVIAALIAFFPAKIFGVKLFFDTRGFLADKYVSGGLLAQGSFAYRLIRWGENLLMNKCHYLTVETYKHAEVIGGLNNSLFLKMGVIPCCVDAKKFDYRLYAKEPNERGDLIYMGKIGTWYLMEEMFNFFNVLAENFPNAHFTVLTESEASSVCDIAEKEKADISKVRVRKVQADEVPAVLADSKVGIFFMNQYKQYAFFPIKFGEYLACGLPVIVNAGIRDCDDIILKERVGVVIDEFSVKEYKRAVRELSLLFAEGNLLRQRCRMVSEKYFSLESGVEKYWNIYKKLSLSFR